MEEDQEVSNIIKSLESLSLAQLAELESRVHNLRLAISRNMEDLGR
jgi:hypothetical protein